MMASTSRHETPQGTERRKVPAVSGSLETSWATPQPFNPEAAAAGSKGRAVPASLRRHHPLNYNGSLETG